MNESHLLTIGNEIRQACIHAAREGFRDASMSGLCADGASEAAISAIERIDIEELLNTLQVKRSDGNSS